MMKTTPTAMMSQSQTRKPSSIPSAMATTMMKLKAATVHQLLRRECDSATVVSLGRSPPEALIARRAVGAQPRSLHRFAAAVRAHADEARALSVRQDTGRRPPGPGDQSGRPAARCAAMRSLETTRAPMVTGLAGGGKHVRRI